VKRAVAMTAAAVLLTMATAMSAAASDVPSAGKSPAPAIAAGNPTGVYGPYTVVSAVGTCLATDWNRMVYAATNCAGQQWYFIQADSGIQGEYYLRSTVTSLFLSHFDSVHLWTAPCFDDSSQVMAWKADHTLLDLEMGKWIATDFTLTVFYADYHAEQAYSLQNGGGWPPTCNC
jgi:hypothetical protein